MPNDYVYTCNSLPSWATLTSTGLLTVLTTAPPGSYSITVQVSNGLQNWSRAVPIYVAQPLSSTQVPYFKVGTSVRILLDFSLLASFAIRRRGDSDLGLQFKLEASYRVPSLAGMQLGLTATFTSVVSSSLSATALLELSAAFSVSALVIGGYSTSIATPLGSAGLASLFAGGDDDSNVPLADIGFDFFVYGVNRRASLFVGSNGYVTFGFGSSAYSSLSFTNPGAALMISAADRSYQAVWAGSRAVDQYTVRYEGNSSSGGGVSNMIWELTFFASGAMMLVTGGMASTNGVTGITNGTGSNSNAFVATSNSSWAIEPQPSGGYLIRQGSYT